MIGLSGEFSFLEDTHVKIDKRIDISISVTLKTTKFEKHLHLQELTQMSLIRQVMVTSSRQYRVVN